MEKYKTSRSFKSHLRRLLYGRTSSATFGNHVLFSANVLIIVLSVAGLLFELEHSFVYLEFGFGLLFLAEYLFRFLVSRHKATFIFRMVNILDVFVIGSLLLTIVAPSLAFLRMLRLLQIMRVYKLTGKRFDHHNEFIHRNFEVFMAVVNISMFLATMSVITFYQQGPINENINSMVDAVYFTVATVTTTGFGDIVVVGSLGKFISIFIMVFGVALFFSLIKSIFSPRRLHSVCHGCGHDSHPLQSHFCGRCGHKIKNHHYVDYYHKHKDDF